MLVEADTFRRQVIGADDRRIARRVAAGKVPAFQDADIGDAVGMGEVIGAGQSMAAAADDDDVVGFLEILGFGDKALGRIFLLEAVAEDLQGNEGREHMVTSLC